MHQIDFYVILFYKQHPPDQLKIMYDAVELNFAFPFMTLLTDSRKSFSVANFLRALTISDVGIRSDLIANIPASVQTDRNSAPVAFGQSREISSNRISRSTLILPELEGTRDDTPLCMNLQNVSSTFDVRKTELDFSVNSAWSE